ncbi:hypothetical protein AB1Y20_007601 [Prymnesium parvum]|uniref:Peptidylamidoglycolate lyase n=1 Tax=Prymnesium parvum TaxID=97485 RepID=A0AB34IXG2_PRYPA|mmetsp:Transcript_26151/g.59764  ORF Transcript_26151/g.59764 Transcript_26151/m.59764 type:complete len:309 (-) Transcript_26151:527-1453(-)
MGIPLALLLSSHANAAVLPRCEHILRHVRSVGAKGRRLGEFNAPCYLAEPSCGLLCVVEGQNGRVQLLDAEAQPLRSIDGLQAPTGVAVSGDTIYVAESTGAHTITARRLSDGAEIRRAGGLGSGEGELHDPQSLLVVGDHLLVTEWGNHRISVFEKSTLAFERHIGQTSDEHGDPVEGSGPGELDQPCDVAIHGDELFVADTWNHRISVFDLSDGSFRRSFGERGTSPGQFIYPTGIAVAKGCLLIAESRGKRVQVLNLDGSPLTISNAPCDGWLHGIRVDAERVWVTSSNKHQLHLLSLDTPPTRR